MANEHIIVIFNIVILVVFIIITMLSRKFLAENQLSSVDLEKEKKTEALIEKYFENGTTIEEKRKFQEMDVLKHKIEGEIQKETSKMTKKAKYSVKKMNAETQMIEQGGKAYSMFGVGLKSAMPRNTKEHTKDMTDLMDAVKMLEGFDQDQYKQESSDRDDIARGLFFDRIATKINRVMRKEKLNKVPYIIFDKIVVLGYNNVKNVTRKDIKDSLNFMKDTGYIKGYIEINPQLIIITQTEEELKFSNPEKVVLVFIYEEDDPLTLEKLMEGAKWKKDYALKIINGLVDKGIAIFENNEITIKGFETKEEKQTRKLLEKEIDDRLKEKEKNRLEQQKSLEKEYEDILPESPEIEEIEKLTPEEEKEIKEEEEKKRKSEAEIIKKAEAVKNIKKPSVKSLPQVKSLKKSSKIKGNIKVVETKIKSVPKPSKEVDLSADELVGVDDGLKDSIAGKKEILENEVDPFAGIDPGADLDMESLMSNINKNEKSEKAENTGDPDLDNLNFDDLDFSQYVGDDADEELSEEAIIDGILSIYEKYEHINGGLFDVRMIHINLLELYVDITIEEIEKCIDSLKKMGLVKDVIDLKPVTLWLFKFSSKKLDENTLLLLKEIGVKGYITKKEAMKSLNWDEEKVLNVMKKLQDLEVLRLDDK
ncbi:MAG: hypothetical protein GY870_18310, partial [archaeon]|nr:hypothetical protein [archaeon]